MPPTVSVPIESFLDIAGKGGANMTVIFRSSKKLKDGTVIYAKNYGKKAFRIVLDNDKKAPRKKSV